MNVYRFRLQCQELIRNFNAIDLRSLQHKFDFNRFIRNVDLELMALRYEDKLFHTHEPDHAIWFDNILMRLLARIGPDVLSAVTTFNPWVGAQGDLQRLFQTSSQFARYGFFPDELALYWTKISKTAVVIINVAIGPWHYAEYNDAYIYIRHLMSQDVFRVYIGIQSEPGS